MNPTTVPVANDILKLTSVWTPFRNWQFVAAFVVIFIVLTFAKRFIAQVAPKVAKANWFSATLTLANLGLGALLAIPKGFLFGGTYFERLLIGLIAGGLNHMLFHLIIKRVAVIMGKSEKEIEDMVDGDENTKTEEKTETKVVTETADAKTTVKETINTKTEVKTEVKEQPKT
jgi:hypothetical protein